MSNGLIDYDKSNIDAKQYIYYPIVDPLLSAIVVKEESSLSLLSNSDSFDNVSSYSSTTFEKIIKNINETWLFCEIMGLLRYRINEDNIQGPLADYLNNLKEFQLVENNNHCSSSVAKEEEEEKKSIVSKDNMIKISSTSQKEEECCCNKYQQQ